MDPRANKFAAPKNRPESICDGCTRKEENCRKTCTEYAVEKIAYICGKTEIKKARQLREDLHALGMRHKLEKLSKERRNRK